jgi:hypothetical protein
VPRAGIEPGHTENFVTQKAETASIRINKLAAELVREIAAVEGCTPQQWLEALLHYGGSCHKRPGSCEANSPFDLRRYLSEDCLADKWF